MPSNRRFMRGTWPFDFLRGREPYKFAWGASAVPLYVFRGEFVARERSDGIQIE
jgi:hypothetical protein